MDNNINDLTQWVLDTLPDARIQERDGEIVIYTGLTEDMGGYLYPIGEESNV